jgi:hypothetical protein
MWRFKDNMNTPIDTLDEYEAKAHGQDDKILALFRKFPDVAMTPPEVKTLLGVNDTTLLTSVRRSLNTLANLKFLEVLPEKRKGIYNRPNYQYKLR